MRVQLAVGDSFGRYEIVAPLGTGGMAHVYRARDTVLERSVALKILRPDREDDEDAVARFDREARMAARLTHPNTIRVYDIGVAHEKPYIAMEWVDGHPLSLLARHHDITRDRLVGILLGAARGLSAAHDLKLVHRDVKPSNIMVTRDDTAKIVDFGLVKRHSASMRMKKLTGHGWILGTPQYMAPEQLETADVDARADQFAWGMTAFVVLSHGFHPRDNFGSFADGRVPRLEDYVDVPTPIADVVERAMQERPSDRYPSMKEVILALETAIAVGRVHFTGPPPAMPPVRTSVLYCPSCAENLDENRTCRRCGYVAGGRQRSVVPAAPSIVPTATKAGAFQRRATSCPIAPIVAASISPDGREAVAIGSRGIARWSRNEWTLDERTLTGFSPERVRCMAYLADGSILVGGDGALVVTISRDGAARKWPVGLIGADRVNLLAIEASDRTLVGIGAGGTGMIVRAYDRGATTALACPAPLTGIARASNGVAFACGPSGHLCQVMGDETLALSAPAGLELMTMIAAGPVVFATGPGGSACRIDGEGNTTRERTETRASMELLARGPGTVWAATSAGELLRRDAGDPRWRLVHTATGDPFRAVALHAGTKAAELVALGMDGSFVTSRES